MRFPTHEDYVQFPAEIRVLQRVSGEVERAFLVKPYVPDE
jgi:hypothetical protein